MTLPLRLGAADEFAAARDLLATSGYTERAVCERTGAPRIQEFQTLGQGRSIAVDVRDPLDVLVHLFLDGVPVAESAIRALLPPRGVEALLSLGLMDRHPEHAGYCAASVMLYPVESLYVTSDLDRIAPGLYRPEELEQPDHVFSAITTLTGTFMEQLPRTPCARVLELCAGTGIAALAAARFCGHAWTVDITERSTRFAEFNARLNGIGNFTALQGDLYAPVAGMRFDRIVAHPPYVPAAEQRMIYRDGGADGEEILRRVVAGLPEHLAPGGRFYCTCMATDRRQAPLEKRLRTMLGAGEEEFDVLVVSHYLMHPTEYYSRLAAADRVPFSLVEQRHQLFRELEAENIVYCSVAMQRRRVERAPFTLRRERAENAAWRETERLLDWRTAVAEADVAPALLEARPILSPGARLHLTHRVARGEWEMDTCQVKIGFPFIRAMDVSVNVAMLLTLFDGTLSTREILRRIKEAGAVDGEVPEEAFAQFVRELVTEGVLEVDALPGMELEPLAAGPSAPD